MSERPTEFEIDILRECAGEKLASSWGAAVGVALEALEGFGYVRRGIITEKGRDFLRSLAKEKTS